MNEYYLEINLKSEFNIIRETLTRIGIESDNNVIYQTCHILHDKGKYYLVHFKELFSMFSFKNDRKIDKEKIHMVEDDFYRRNSIIFLMENWGLIETVNKDYIIENKGNIKIKVIPFKEKANYKFISKFKLGKEDKE